MTTRLTIFLAGVVLASVGQLLLKKGAVRGVARGSRAASFLDPFALAGYALMLASTVTSTLALKVLPLKLTVSLLPLGYLLVALGSIWFLGERLQRRKRWGMAIIVAGIILFNQGPT